MPYSRYKNTWKQLDLMSEIKKLINKLKEEVLLLDGAMGTMIQKEKLTEQDFRGQRFADSKINLQGNNDILNITNKELIYNIHRLYLESGADIIETNTFNSTQISQADFNCQEFSGELNFEGGIIARRAVDDYLKKNPKENKYVAGVLGPTNRTCSMSPDVNDPSFRNVGFDDLLKDYELSVTSLLKAKVDLIFIETVFDTLNSKAALMAIKSIEKKKKDTNPFNDFGNNNRSFW